MKKNKLYLCITLLVMSSLLITGCGKTSELKTEKTTAVSIKGSKITADQYYKELKKDSIEKLITMLDHKILDKKYPTTDEETESINKQIESIKSYYKDNEDQYLAAIKSYFGVSSEKELKEKLSLEYKRNEAVKDYVKKNLTDAEIKKYYEENIYPDIKASHILFSVETTDKMSDDEKNKIKDKALKKAKKVIKELDAGKDFSELAKKYSEDDATKEKGGDLGYFSSDDMDGSFWNAALELKKDEYTKEPVESAYGYHIILKTGEKAKKSLKEAKADIQKKLSEEKLKNDKSLYYKSLMAIRKDKKITFGDSDLEKQYEDYMDNLIDTASNSNSNQ